MSGIVKRARLSKIKVTEVSLVDRPANQYADVILAKRQDFVDGVIDFDQALELASRPLMIDDLIRLEKAKPISFEEALKLPVRKSALLARESAEIGQLIAIGKAFDESKHPREPDGRFARKDGTPLGDRVRRAAAAIRESAKNRYERSKGAQKIVAATKEFGALAAEKVKDSVTSIRATRINPIEGGGVQVQLQGKDPFGRDVYVRHQILPGDIKAKPGDDASKSRAKFARNALATVSTALAVFGHEEVPVQETRTVIRRVKEGDRPDFSPEGAYDYAEPGVGERYYKPGSAVGATAAAAAAPTTTSTASSSTQSAAPIRSTYTPKPTPQPTYAPTPPTEARLKDLQAMGQNRPQPERDFINAFHADSLNEGIPRPGSPTWKGSIAPGFEHKGFVIPRAPTDYQIEAKKWVDRNAAPAATTEAALGASRPLADKAPAGLVGDRDKDGKAYEKETAAAEARARAQARSQSAGTRASQQTNELIAMTAHKIGWQAALEAGVPPAEIGGSDEYLNPVVDHILAATKENPDLDEDKIFELQDDQLRQDTEVVGKSDQPRDDHGRFASVFGSGSKSAAVRAAIRRGAARAMHRLAGPPEPGESKAAYTARALAGVTAEHVVGILSSSGMPDIAPHAGPIAEHVVRYVSAHAGRLRKDAPSTGAIENYCAHCMDSIKRAAEATYDAHQRRAGA